MKELYLFRHGIAVDVGQCGVKCDVDRMLSDKGRTRTREAARGLKVMECTPQRIVASPLLRAMQTAEIAAKALGLDDTEIHDDLCPWSSLNDTVDWLLEQPEDSIMLVGHLPHLPELACCMIGGSSPSRLTLKKAGACMIIFPESFRPGTGSLEWIIEPHMLRTMGEQ